MAAEEALLLATLERLLLATEEALLLAADEAVELRRDDAEDEFLIDPALDEAGGNRQQVVPSPHTFPLPSFSPPSAPHSFLSMQTQPGGHFLLLCCELTLEEALLTPHAFTSQATYPSVHLPSTHTFWHFFTHPSPEINSQIPELEQFKGPQSALAVQRTTEDA